jgi:hypothetical protein
LFISMCEFVEAHLQRRWEGAHFLQCTIDTTNLTLELH